jgi:hypothetical protein
MGRRQREQHAARLQGHREDGDSLAFSSSSLSLHRAGGTDFRNESIVSLSMGGIADEVEGVVKELP